MQACTTDATREKYHLFIIERAKNRVAVSSLGLKLATPMHAPLQLCIVTPWMFLITLATCMLLQRDLEYGKHDVGVHVYVVRT